MCPQSQMLKIGDLCLSETENFGCPVWNSYRTRGTEKEAWICGTGGVLNCGTLCPGPLEKARNKEGSGTHPRLIEKGLQKD